MRKLLEIAPSEGVTDYDRRNLMTYAELLDADAHGITWEEGAASILGYDPIADARAAQLCWITHLARARWIVGEGLASAVDVFGRPRADYPLD